MYLYSYCVASSKGYAQLQGITLRDYLIFSVIYRGLSCHKWLRAGASYDNLTHDVVLAFLSQICMFNKSTKIFIILPVIVACFSETDLVYF